MIKTMNPAVCIVTTADEDKLLLQQVADIERSVQPSDYWEQRTITDTLQQPHNHCWALLNANASNYNECEVVAYCIWSCVFEVAEILRIGTHPQFRRRGYARELLQSLIQDMSARGLERLLLEVKSDNEGAMLLYDDIGFEVIHRRVGYYRQDSPLNKSAVSQLNSRRLERQQVSEHSMDTCDALVMQYLA